MQRIGSAFSGRVRLLFVLLFFIVWRADDVLVRMISASRVWPLLHLDTLGSQTTAALIAARSFLTDAFSFIGTTLADLFGSLPLAVRDVIPTGLLGRCFSGVAALFG